MSARCRLCIKLQPRIIKSYKQIDDVNFQKCFYIKSFVNIIGLQYEFFLLFNRLNTIFRTSKETPVSIKQTSIIMRKIIKKFAFDLS